jgi:uncharacterized membrane protein YjgN (DUF898 family)
MEIRITSLFGLLLLIADIWAILNIVQSREPTINKLLWTLLIIFLPMLGLIIWWLAGPRQNRSAQWP